MELALVLPEKVIQSLHSCDLHMLNASNHIRMTLNQLIDLNFLNNYAFVSLTSVSEERVTTCGIVHIDAQISHLYLWDTEACQMMALSSFNNSLDFDLWSHLWLTEIRGTAGLWMLQAKSLSSSVVKGHSFMEFEKWELGCNFIFLSDEKIWRFLKNARGWLSNIWKP